MPTATAYRRAPLVDPSYVTLPDSAVHLDGVLGQRCQQVLNMVDLNSMSVLDAVLASKLGGYSQMPPMPQLEELAARLPEQADGLIRGLLAGMHIAASNRDKNGMLRVLEGTRAFLDALPYISEEALFVTGADALRLAVELYRRTGQQFLLSLLEKLRSRLPDVSGLMHMFPFTKEYRPETGAANADEQAYYDRLERFANGTGTADSLAMTALLAQYSGSRRDATAAQTGLTVLARYHGMPGGAFSADPYLAGRDPARAVTLEALCAQIEAGLDILCADGKPAVAEHLEKLFLNGLLDMLSDKGIREMSPTNRLAGDDSCEVCAPGTAHVSCLLRALFALRRSVWLAHDDDTVAFMLPVDSGCVTRFGGMPVRLTAKCEGVWERKVSILVESRQPVRFSLQLRIPSYAEEASVSVSGVNGREAAPGELYNLSRIFHNGDEITLTYRVSPRLEKGYRNSTSVWCGSQLMSFCMPRDDMEWRYAYVEGARLTPRRQDQQPLVIMTACAAPEWKEKGGFILPPPQGVAAGQAYELTLLPFAGTEGRIAAFPTAYAGDREA
ncbi:MAG: glycoside hydrolase family 127 protein [Clostridia bacterium]|nr:glycoside hydrolase family 127 protein [Clostridia bacterium]